MEEENEESTFWATLKGNLPANMFTYTDNGYIEPFEPGHKYRYRIAARNRRGLGPSVTSQDIPWITPPLAPLNLTLDSSPPDPLWEKDLGVHLRWQAPPNGGTPITGYKIQRCQGDENTCVSGPWISITIPEKVEEHQDTKGLKKDSTYTYQVLAINAQGEGEVSEMTSLVLPPILPQAPENLVAGLFHDDNNNPYHHLFWKPPAHDGGSPLLNYQVQKCIKNSHEDNKQCRTHEIAGWIDLAQDQSSQIPKTSYKHILLPEEHTIPASSYNYRVSAQNIRGLGPFSAVKKIKKT